MGLDALLAAGDLKSHAATLCRFNALSADQARALGKVQAVDVDELISVRERVLAAATGIDSNEASSDDIELLSAATAVVAGVRKELDRRLATEDSRRVAADKLVAAIAAENENAVAAAGRLQAASGKPRLPSISRLAARQPFRTLPTRTATLQTSPKALTAAGQPVDSLEEASAVAATQIQRMVAQRRGWAGRDLTVLVSCAAEYPVERQLGSDEWANEAKFEAVTGAAALAASGGVCGPVAVDYSVASIASDDRPVKGALAQFGASRGGVRYVLPHSLAQVTGDGPAAIWTEATDASPGGSTKPHATFLCQVVQEAYVDAVTSIVEFGNFQARYFPEQIQQYLTGVEAVHARLAESTLLAAISAGSTAVTYGNAEVGAARDLLAAIDRAASAYRYQNRMSPTAPLRLILPAYVLDMLRADLARNMPGDSGGQSERLAVTNAEIESWFAARAINPTWTLDSFTGAPTLQGFPVQGPGQLAPWPTITYGWLFHEGAWMFLDGGELNLGMVRDSVLNKTNDFQMFSETFEKAVFRGHASVQLALKIDPSGASVGTVTPYSGGSETIGS